MKIKELDLYRDDNLFKRSLDDTRKPTLTLKHINTLRKMREVRNLEKIKSDNEIEQVYGSSSQESTGF